MADHPPTLDLALKEWASVTRLLLGGHHALLLRKGGIAEDDGPGRFRLEHDRFALFPAWEHERTDWLKPTARGASGGCPGPAAEPPARVHLHGHAEVARIWRVPSREAFDRLDDLHPWAAPQIDMRFGYKPDRPLHLLALRCFRWAAPHIVPYRDDYAGCRSWVPLEPADAVPDALIASASPAMSHGDFAAVLSAVDAAFE